MMRIKKRNFIFVLVTAMLIGVFSSGAGFFIWSKATDQMIISSQEYKAYTKVKEDYGKLSALQAMIEQYYYTDVDEDKLYEGIYKGLFAGLDDPYSYYMNASEYENLQISTTGEFSGVGVTLAADSEGYICVVAPIEDTPAAKAGIRPGDRITKVDGVSYSGAQLDEAVQKMRGPAGQTVTLTVLRDGKEKEYTMKRANIVMQTVKSELLDGDIAYIRITSFEKNTAEDFRKALRDFEVAGVKGLIVDLRDNPGGLVDSAVAVADELLPAGTVAYTQNRQGDKEYYKTKGSGTNLPYVLLINGGSASASEILAGAVQDNKGGTLVGTTSYGKGIIQSITPLEDGSGAAVKMTILQYFSPNGNVIHKKGITPDYVVELPEGTIVNEDLDRKDDSQLQKAVEILKKK